MNKYSIGVDFGSLSARALVININTGEEIAVAVRDYKHKVMEEELPSGIKLPLDYALQHPQDYLDSLYETIREVIEKAKVDPKDIIGIGIDFTASTVMPIKRDGTPLCFIDEYKDEPHAYVKLWKHHSAQKYADELNELALKMEEPFLKRYGGKISSEWMIPKIMEIVNDKPDVYDEMDRFIEAADWIVMMLTGVETRNNTTAGYKAIWHKRDGFPSNKFFKALHPKLENFIDDKVGRKIHSIGTKAGGITKEVAEITGLIEGTAVAVANVDAHVTVPAVGINDEGKMLMIIGTSTCDILLGHEELPVEGICGVVEDGVIPGFYGYEAGQSCVGDHFDWAVKNIVPKEYYDEAKARNLNIHTLLTEKAEKLKVGESGLVALDWWNGNRSVLVDVDLTGLIVGQTLQTNAVDIYRALIEATAYGKRMIVDTFNESGVEIKELYAAGGIAHKNEMMMQIYADVTNMPIRIAKSSQAPALGSAMFGAVAAGKALGGYESIVEASKKLGKTLDRVYYPIKENVLVYEKLYQEYKFLHDLFGRENNLMVRLKNIKESARGIKNEK